jgi:hypothetical protein
MEEDYANLGEYCGIHVDYILHNVNRHYSSW